MKRAIDVCFRVNADEHTGLGHLSRCRSLMRVLQDMVEARFFIVSNNEEAVRKFIPDVDFYYSERFDPHDRFDLVVLDLLEESLRKERGRAGNAGLLVCIDDDGPGLPGQDILIRPNLLDLPCPAGMSSDSYWSGKDYIILHPDFSNPDYKWTEKGRDVPELFVCFGGSDFGGLTLRVLPILKELKCSFRVRLVVGAAFTRKKEVDAFVKGDERFLVSGNVSNMAEQLGRVDAAFISGGTMLYEVCALGVPSVILSQNRAQDAEAAMCHKAEAVINLGFNDDVPSSAIAETLDRVMGDAVLRKGLSRQGPRVVAPDGVMRIASGLAARLKGAVVR